MWNDPDILKDGTLKNKLGIIEWEELKQAEHDIGLVKLITLDEVDTTGNPVELMKKVHKHIFEDIYGWAGNYRKINISKREKIISGARIKYDEPNQIDEHINQYISDMYNDDWENTNLDDFAEKFARHITKIWKVHPFRDGNTRTTLAFSYIFAKQHGVDLNMGIIMNNLSREKDEKTDRITKYSIRDRLVLSAFEESEPAPLKKLLRSALSKSLPEKHIEDIDEIRI